MHTLITLEPDSRNQLIELLATDITYLFLNNVRSKLLLNFKGKVHSSLHGLINVQVLELHELVALFENPYTYENKSCSEKACLVGLGRQLRNALHELRIEHLHGLNDVLESLT